MAVSLSAIKPTSNAWQRLASAPAIVVYLAAFKLTLHLLTASNYGPFVDELYFLAAGEHLAWGYVDMPPLTAFLAWLARSLFGTSLTGIHLIPALAGAGLVLITGAIVHELGGKRFAQALAGLGVIIPWVYLIADSYLSMNAIEPLIWMGCALILIRMIKTGDARLWLWFGVLAGLGLLNKHTMALFGFAAIAAMLFTRTRKLMFNRWFLLGGSVALLIFLPNLIWMIQHNFPHLELLANIQRNQRNVELDAIEFLGQQVAFMHPFALPLWLAGLAYFFFHPQGRRFRVLGWAYFITLGILLALQSRVYYLAPVYPMLIAGGALIFEEWLAAPQRMWLKPVSIAALAISGAVLAPLALPLLTPETYIAYAQTLHIGLPTLERRGVTALPQLFADRFGWQEMTQTTARVFHSLSPEEQAQTAIYGEWYGIAGAIDFYGAELGLPKAISGHLTYYYWGPREYTGEIVLVLGTKQPREPARYFDGVEPVATVHHPYTMPDNNFMIYLCRRMKRPLTEVWPELKNWN